MPENRGYQTYVLSNAAQSFYEYFPKFYRMEDFDGVVVSSDVHLIKPDVRIYAYLLEKYHLNPEECLFLDDREDNVEAARKAGMQSMLFTEDYETLRAFLKQNAGIEAYQQKKTNSKNGKSKTLRYAPASAFCGCCRPDFCLHNKHRSRGQRRHRNPGRWLLVRMQRKVAVRHWTVFRRIPDSRMWH